MITFPGAPALRSQLRSAQKTSFLHNLATTLDSSISILSLLEHSIENHCLKLCQQSHAKAQRLGLIQHLLVAQKLIYAYAEFKQPFDFQLVFNGLLVKSTHICNTLLAGYAKNHIFHRNFEIFREMCRHFTLPLADEFTFSTLFKTAADFGDLFHGKMVHGRGLKDGLMSDIVVGNSLMSMYCRCGDFDDSLKVFDEMLFINASSWNTLISGYVNTKLEKGKNSFDNYRLWELVKGMQNEGLKLDAFTISMVLPFSGGLNHGRELHCYTVKNGLDIILWLGSDVHLGCSLIDMYSRNGKVDVSRRVFDNLKFRNVYAWTAMINGYVNSGYFDEAVVQFREMQLRDMLKPNKVTLVTILPASRSSLGSAGVKQIHGFAVRRDMNHELSLCNALIDTYSKSGSLNYAARVFEHECRNKDAISWSSMIFGYGLHGQGELSIALFHEMLKNGIKPDTTVVVGVLSACCRSGLLEEGISAYEYTVNNYGIKPTMEMCACVVDLLGKSGQLDRAIAFIRTMPVEPSPSIWGALVCASALHGNSEMAYLAYKSLIKIEPDNPSNYISLSNLCAASSRWDIVAEVRRMMRERGLRKSPGCSWISINSITHSFFVADKTHPCSNLIYAMLNELVSTMKLSYYNPEETLE